jgi:transglutaminase-like putative cysteine protease
MGWWMRGCCIVVAAGIAALFTCFQSSAETASLEIVRDHVDYDVSADGSYVERQEKMFRILSPQGLDALREITVSYTEGYQDASIEDAYTLKRDGTRIEVPQNRVFLSYGETTASGFHDQKTKVAVFQDAQVGDEVGYVTVFKQKTPWYVGQFFTSFMLAPDVPLHDFIVTFTVPSSLKLQLDAQGLSGGPLTNDGANRRWSFTYDSSKDGNAYLVATTFESFAALARAYDDRARDKAVITPEIKTLADRLAAGANGRRDMARRLYDWVSGNIKYVALIQGEGALVPHFAADVLHSGYGDCKDHVTLLQALLAAEGIQSSPALIDLEPNYRLPSVASPEQFDHVITYIPEFTLFVDSTANLVPFGLLPRDDLDKPVLMTAAQRLARTPSETGGTASLAMVSEIHIVNDGTATGDLEFSATGSLAVDLHQKLANDGPQVNIVSFGVPGLVQGTLTQSGSGTAQDPYTGHAQYRLENTASFERPGAVSFEIGFRPQPIESLLDAALPERQDAYVCPSFSVSDETTITLPQGIAIISMPKPAEVRVEGEVLSTHYEKVSDYTVRATITLTAQHPDMLCSAAYYNHVRAGLSRMAGLLNAQVVYVPRDDEGSRLAQGGF